jgi:hypothetical protein
MSESSFHERLQSHRGGLVRVSRRASVMWGSRELSSKIGILVEAGSVLYDGGAWVDMLIDGKIRPLYVYPGDLEFIGADDE